MGGAVSSGRDNDELIDNLMGSNYIKSRTVERVFRALDRAEYMTPESRDQAYKDLAWRSGPLHMSAPCIYSVVMEGLELKPGLSFLNVGSGTGYLSTLVGLVLGSTGINHGIEIRPIVVDYSTKKLRKFMENSATVDEFDFCEPRFYTGNGLCLAPLQTPYDRVYCGAGCPEEYQNYFKQLIKVGGMLVMPLNDNLLQVRRTEEARWTSRKLLNVSFASLREPSKHEAGDLIKLEEQTPPRLQVLARAEIRCAMRGALLRCQPELREPPPRQPPAKRACPHSICIPIDDESDAEGLDNLHDLDPASGAHEMNALLSLVLSMGQNRVAGSLRVGEDSDSSDDPPYVPPRRVPDGDNGDGEEVTDYGDDDEIDEDTYYSDSSTEFDDPAQPSSENDSPPDDDDYDEEDARRVYFISPHAIDARETLARIAARHRRRKAVERKYLAMPREQDRDNSPSEFNRARLERLSRRIRKSKRARKARRERKRLLRESKNNGEGEGTSSQVTETQTQEDANRTAPAEVEIYLGKTEQPAGGAAARACSDDDAAPRGSLDKRQKLDSGLGEENSPSSESSPLKSEAAEAEAKPSDAGGAAAAGGRRRRQKRASRSASSGSASSGGRGRRKRRAADAGDARRVRLSTLMKRAVKELPLPYALKKYVNLQRCFDI